MRLPRYTEIFFEPSTHWLTAETKSIIIKSFVFLFHLRAYDFVAFLQFLEKYLCLFVIDRVLADPTTHSILDLLESLHIILCDYTNGLSVLTNPGCPADAVYVVLRVAEVIVDHEFNHGDVYSSGSHVGAD